MRKILGIPATLFVLAVLLVGSGTALLVKYFSNTVTHTVSVDSPIELTGDTPLSINIYGGEAITYTITTKNLADIVIESYPITEITGPDVWSGTEFSEVLLENSSGIYNLTSLLYVIKDDGSLIPFSEVETLSTATVKLFFDSTLHTYTRSVGFEKQDTYTFTTNPAIMPGVYTIRSCELFDWSSSCP